MGKQFKILLINKQYRKQTARENENSKNRKIRMNPIAIEFQFSY